MNERFLARGKCENTKKWCYGYYLDTPKYTYQSDERTYAISRCSGYLDGGQTKVSSETVSQCVGIKDRSGNWIVEGDIVEFNHPYNGKSKHTVVWDNYTWSLSDFYVTCFDYPSEAFSEGTKHMTVIGNVYDNPEILEAKTQTG